MIIPRMKFEGSDTAKQMNRIFAENLQDLVNKVDYGGGKYETGFLHTSTLLHEGTCYYDDVWSRDGGRGLIELTRFGFAREALLVARYFLRHINHGNHWGRVVQKKDEKWYEVDGNSLILLGIYLTWKVNGKRKDIGCEFIEETFPVFEWMEHMMDECPYGDLLPCESELSGNPNSPYQVYAIFPNYAALVAMTAFESMCTSCGCFDKYNKIKVLRERLSRSIMQYLVAKENGSLTPLGCWINGLDGRDGRPYEFSEWDGTSWPIYHWTRQLPFVLNADIGGFCLPKDDFYPVHLKSYLYIHKYMSSGYFFRKYGFVSNSGWTGMGGRHDDTMCGYGQGFMTQAALLMDDINTYTKLLEGVTRLAYDGDVVNPLTYEMNPWLLHECFNYENYEQGYDHTFGVMSKGRPGIMDNPGDEGNLVQAAEVIKALAISAGVDTSNDGTLRIMPRIPWTWDEIYLKDFPIMDENWNLGRLEFRMMHERWMRKSFISINTSFPLKNIEVRVGPFPAYIEVEKDNTNILEIERSIGGTWVWIKGLKGDKVEREIKLVR